MRLRRMMLLGWVGVWLLIVVTPAWSILIETGPVKRRVGGYLVSDDGKKLVLRVPGDAGTSKVETFDRSKVKIIHQVDRRRLEALRRDDPSAYREYAEELAKQKADPEAVDLAMRLFLVAAYLDPARNGPSCLLAMSELATNPADARKYRALAFLLDAKRDRSVLKGNGAAQTDFSEAALKSFQKALKDYRTGDVIDARVLATAKGVGSCFRAVPGMMDQDAFVQACTDAVCPQCKYTNRNSMRCAACNGKGKFLFGNPICPTCKGKGVVKCSLCDGAGVNRARIDAHVDAMVRGELWALNRLAPDTASKQKPVDARSWATALSNPQLTPIPQLTLESVTDYDPRKCVFRNGGWVAP